MAVWLCIAVLVELVRLLWSFLLPVCGDMMCFKCMMPGFLINGFLIDGETHNNCCAAEEVTSPSARHPAHPEEEEQQTAPAVLAAAH
jgi:hypothetical protein